ncbi:hypothetical protein [Burkholderia sp. F1]|uniref:hypothetical protein n=1 Tax=Burkholderia sp. F1 TaxID=3366817 RepID=UPI003D739BCF
MFAGANERASAPVRATAAAAGKDAGRQRADVDNVIRASGRAKWELVWPAMWLFTIPRRSLPSKRGIKLMRMADGCEKQKG